MFLMEQPDGATPKPVKAGDSLGLDVPLLRLNEGMPQAIAITLYFTDLPAGAAALDQVTKCYANFPMEGLRYVQVQVALPPAADPKAWGSMSRGIAQRWSLSLSRTNQHQRDHHSTPPTGETRRQHAALRDVRSLSPHDFHLASAQRSLDDSPSDSPFGLGNPP